MLERQHTLSSELIGHDSLGEPRFGNTKRTELGELIFRLKNRNDKATLGPIAETAAAFVQGWGIEFDALVPVPPSRPRALQPVIEITRSLSELLRRPMLANVVTKVKETPELKNVFDYSERQRLLEGVFLVDENAVTGRRLLLVDDLYRSGATAAVVANALVGAGAAAVYFLAMTKTRTLS